MNGLSQDPGILRNIYGAILRNPIFTDPRYVDNRDVDTMKQFQRSWARDEVFITSNWWKLKGNPNSESTTQRNPWALERDSERFVRESDTYGNYSQRASGLAQSSIQALSARLETMKRENDSLVNDLRKANEKIEDYHDKFRVLKYDNEQLKKNAQFSIDRSEMSRILKDKQVMRDRIRELESYNQKLSQDLAKRNAQDLLQRETRRVSAKVDIESVQSDDDILINSSWISKEYQHLLTQDWLAARNAFSQFSSCVGVTEQLKCEILSTVLVSACEKAESVFGDLKQNIRKIINTAPSSGDDDLSARDAYFATPRYADNTQPVQKWFKKPVQEFSGEFEKVLSNELRVRSHDVNVSTWVKKLLGDELEKYHMLPYAARLDILRSPMILHYVERGCALAWQMTIQLPLMYVTCDGVARPCDPKRHEMGSLNTSYVGANVLFFFRPTLYQGDKVVVRGKVHTHNHFSKHV